MKYLAIASLLVAATAAHAVQDCDLNGQSVNPDNGNTTAGKTGLMRCRDRDSGELQREQELHNGKFMGLERFYDKGKLSREHSINEKGNRQGRAREFNAQGQVLYEATYDNGSEVGLSRRFHANGALRRAAFHSRENDEQASAEFNDKGQLTQLRCAASKGMLAPAVDDARLCGFSNGASQVQLFNDRGALYARASYQDGKRIRFEQFYDDGKTQLLQENSAARTFERQMSRDGVRRREMERTLDGKTVTAMRLQQFSESGTLVRDQRWTAGKLSLDAEFYLNGQPRSKLEYSYADGAPNAAATILETGYRDDGSVVSTGRYLEPGRGRRVATGTHQAFNVAGKLVAESVYDDKGRISRERVWDDTGATLLRDDAVFEDGSRKAFAR